MAEQIVQTNIPNDILKKELKMQEFANLKSPGNIGGITRERSFVRMSSNNSNQNHHQNVNKRRSLAFTTTQHQQQQQQQQLRVKPAMEIYRPPNVRVEGGGPQNKLNVHAQEFQMNRDMPNSRSSIAIFPTHGNLLNHSKSGNNLQQQMQQLAARQHAVQMANLGGPHTILVSHPIQLSQMGAVIQSSQMPLVNSPSSGNLLHSTPRVKFAPEPQLQHHHQQHQHQNNAYQNKVLVNNNNNNINNNNIIGGGGIGVGGPLQRSKSLSSADTIARGIAGLGLAIGNEATDIGTFIPEIQTLVDQATTDPNQLNARSLMELANHIMQRAVEGRRYALPTSRFCISIIAKEQKETFLEALLNTCRQWYQEREKVLGPPHSIKNSSRPRFTAFMAFLTEMFCQLKRRQLQLRTKCDGVPPPIVLLTLLSKCCENCVKPPVRSLSEIECLFFVLTCIGRDLECHLAQQLETLLASVRDAFLNSNASAPAIRRTLLQLIELQASRWQLPGNTVLYYYPSSK